MIVANLLRDRHHRHQPLITRLSGVTASPPYCHSARASPDTLQGVTVVMTSLSFAISESAASSRVGCLAHRHRFLGGIQVAAPPALVRCRARAQRVITRRTPARPESIRAGDAPCCRINPFRRSHIFAVSAA